LSVLRGDGRYGGGLVVASRGYMGPNEVQALIGQWVDLIGNGKDRDKERDKDRDKERERRERERLSRGAGGSPPPPSWGQQSSYQQPQPYPSYPPYPVQSPYQGAPYQAQPPWYSQSYQQPYPQPLPASAYRQPLPSHPSYPLASVYQTPSSAPTAIRDHRGQSSFWNKAAHTLNPLSYWIGTEGSPALEAAPFPPRAAVVDAPLPTSANRDILPMSTSVPILPTQSAQITGRPQCLVFKIGRFVISNAGTAGGSADWIVNDIKIGNVSQFVQSGDVPGDMFATNAIDTFVRFAPAQTAMDVVVVVTYIGLNESGCPFFGAMVGTAAI
jgi:hypothetical protein